MGHCFESHLWGKTILDPDRSLWDGTLNSVSKADDLQLRSKQQARCILGNVLNKVRARHRPKCFYKVYS